MADKKITELDALAATPDDADILAIVDDVAVTPVTKKITVANLLGSVPVKATGAEIDTGTDDAKFATPKAIDDSDLAKTSDITGTNSGTNTGDEIVATGAEVNTGTDNVKYTSAKAIKDSKLSYIDGTETLTNKTITTPAISNPTGLDSTDVGLANVNNTSDATKNSATATLTNKSITPRVLTFTTDATPEVDSDDYDVVTITAQDAAITDVDMVGSAEVNFQKLIFRIKDDGTARAIAWGSDFEAGGEALPTTTVISKTLLVGFIYDSVDSKWACEATKSRA